MVSAKTVVMVDRELTTLLPELEKEIANGSGITETILGSWHIREGKPHALVDAICEMFKADCVTYRVKYYVPLSQGPHVRWGYVFERKAGC